MSHILVQIEKTRRSCGPTASRTKGKVRSTFRRDIRKAGQNVER